MKPARRFWFDPVVLGIKLSGLYAIYREHWRHYRGPELMAGTGIAIGVSLVFGVLVANSSILGSTREAINAVNGSASLELVARSPRGFDQELAQRVSTLPGVQTAVPILRESTVMEGPNGHMLGQLVGVSPRIVGLQSSATKDLGAGAQLLQGGVGLPSGVASAIGAHAEGQATLLVNGSRHRVLVRAVLDAGAIGSLAASRIVVTLLNTAQNLAGEPGRVTQVLVKAYPGKNRQVEGELRRLAAGRLNVEPANHELELAQTALKPTNQSTSLFAAISLMVGFLLALNAMLLTVPDRRWQIAELREQGYDSRQVIAVLGSQALVLGFVASVAGVLVGYVLARTIFDEVPDYLATTFPITGHQQIGFLVVVVAFSCGVLAAFGASILPIFDLRKSREIDAVLREPGEPGQGVGGDIMRNAALLGLVFVALAMFMVVLNPGLAILSGVALAFAAPCFMPILFRAATGALGHIARRYHGKMVAIATIELEATAARSVALASITALAIYGSVAVGGARTDLIGGIDKGISQEWSTAAVWVTPDQNIFDTDSFHVPGVAATISHAAGVASVSAHQGAFLDVGSQRLWIRAVPPGSASMILSSELRQGSLEGGRALMRQDGWAAVSSGFATEYGLHVGSPFTLPTPAGPTRFKVAAITTNIGWPPGAITLNTNDYSHYWQTTDPTTLAVAVKPGIRPSAAVRSIRQALGSTSALRVQTSSERIVEVKTIGRQGLSVLGDISSLLLLISALALAAALSTTIYQRRRRLASLKAQGFDRHQLWRGVLIESAVVLGTGCLDGAILGMYGHALADRYLRVSTSFPAPFHLGAAQIILTLLIVGGVSLAVVAVPGYSAAGVAPELSFQE
ncbi:MAG TPA: FtsX-like permease family protein [Solirubrobacteraceae bacterium]|jgi:putative ABC transport system permease protein|nr:FtsX-like permease family protein [Solirubrobacteraceae bacterium]